MHVSVNACYVLYHKPSIVSNFREAEAWFCCSTENVCFHLCFTCASSCLISSRQVIQSATLVVASMNKHKFIHSVCFLRVMKFAQDKVQEVVMASVTKRKWPCATENLEMTIPPKKFRLSHAIFLPPQIARILFPTLRNPAQYGTEPEPPRKVSTMLSILQFSSRLVSSNCNTSLLASAVSSTLAGLPKQQRDNP